MSEPSLLGDQDLYLTNDGPNRLFRNDGDGRFADVTGDSFLLARRGAAADGEGVPGRHHRRGPSACRALHDGPSVGENRDLTLRPTRARRRSKAHQVLVGDHHLVAGDSTATDRR